MTTTTSKKSFKHFGVHLTLDGYQASEHKLNDVRLVFKILDDLPGILGMRKIITPYVIPCESNDKKDPGGVSGFVIIAESHISIHTFAARRFVSIDVYTCQDTLDTKKAIEYLKKALDIQQTEVNVIKRGLKFGKLAGLPR
ncbi:MAG: S-adenosylmethionine decarboxylase proenzyme [Candidatus Kerfeldbacteria bacterium RIFCSPHIGHO2_02_FULL_42_14]|uniref:S-adenosylmethionine decarboxylase proenzyme n=1 Tax=Candidatus Kerfeldbacteria bacterium RIFCSPHIGHO2_02_FULL_42_14 TaxID=1798540 RepID=A0A1G2ARI8_9BACT|nr:MAG: S-adenosylmethionine decarboxylase proenzyme [Candidatus Kerfeldbacteria bacterium RIFCSPHIGHO2_02_FULL_42_14]OGY81017.1 MAG: S-adenosylmethionine decarboxylase proenzyme [Candidatus Kerfeldbacteria bacterium RIFCSPHIGHO2_12_FULL_42_13]OGY84949.1 MAG: S-adenosylmethionine decarboxylase proenzyme [Candidatus Kerfeldbacteria bacterium RIFCSPLOWO2_02_FULL_42_19]OGY86117.1 MAG: S-adenosylmethionine decarboxylase proenzyme [Candidatus Kerfeldbacteria bacterium RIFCSPLOWO2_12_FULL_43_9]